MNERVTALLAKIRLPLLTAQLLLSAVAAGHGTSGDWFRFLWLRREGVVLSPWTGLFFIPKEARSSAIVPQRSAFSPVPPKVAGALIIPIGMVASYLGHSRFSFRRTRRHAHDATD